MRSDLTCPVEIERVRVNRNEEEGGAQAIVCEIGFLNLVEREIDSVQMNIVCFDAQDNRLGGRLVRASARKAGGDERRYDGEFLPEHVDDTVRVEASVEKVWFKDGVVWRREERNVREYAPNALPEGRELDRLRAVAGPDAMGYPREEDVLWLCVCGRANPIGEEACLKCHRERAQVLRDYAYPVIESTVGRRERELERTTRENLRRSSEQTVREQTADQKRRAKRRRRARLAVALLALVAVALAVCRWGAPMLAMEYGKYKLDSGLSADAKAVFDFVGAHWPNQFDAAEWSAQAETRIVEGLIAANTDLSLTQAQERAAAMGTAEGDALAERAALARATLMEQSGDTDGAEALYRSMTGSEEANRRLLALIYAVADDAQERLDYPTAIARFASLGEYSDAAARREECIYLYGRQLLRDGHYEQAAEQFLLVSGMDDAVERTRESYYKLAQEKQEAGDFVGAAALYERLGVYEEAESRARACRYEAGMAALEANDLEEAAAQLEQAKGYEDATARFEEVAATLGARAMEAGDPEMAVVWLSKLAPTEGSKMALDEATYALAEKRQAEGDRERAAQTFASLGDYQDAPERASALEYDIALDEMGSALEDALMRFELLGDYEDASEQARRCRYLIAEAAFDGGEYERAAALYDALGGYENSESRARRCRYLLAGELQEAGRYDDAAAMYDACGAYLDAEENASRCRYEAAAGLYDAGEYAQAAKAFAALGSYDDAPARARASEDAWLADAYDEARMDTELGDYDGVIAALEGVWQAELPARYGDIPALYEQACLARADELTAQGRPFEALAALRRIPENEDAQDRLDANLYKLIGTWETVSGARYVFREDGSCSLDGREAYYGGGGYDILVGDAPYPTERAYSFVALRGGTLTLRDAGTDALLRLSYVGEPLDLTDEPEADGGTDDAREDGDDAFKKAGDDA